VFLESQRRSHFGAVAVDVLGAIARKIGRFPLADYDAIYVIWSLAGVGWFFRREESEHDLQAGNYWTDYSCSDGDLR
jgi:hypothetical protein